MEPLTPQSVSSSTPSAQPSPPPPPLRTVFDLADVDGLRLDTPAYFHEFLGRRPARFWIVFRNPNRTLVTKQTITIVIEVDRHVIHPSQIFGTCGLTMRKPPDTSLLSEGTLLITLGPQWFVPEPSCLAAFEFPVSLDWDLRDWIKLLRGRFLGVSGDLTRFSFRKPNGTPPVPQHGTRDWMWVLSIPRFLFFFFLSSHSPLAPALATDACMKWPIKQTNEVL